MSGKTASLDASDVGGAPIGPSPAAVGEVGDAEVAREYAALCEMFGAVKVTPPVCVGCISEATVAERYSTRALLLLATQEADTYTETLRTRVKEMCILLLHEETEVKLVVLAALEAALERFARPHRMLDITPDSTAHQQQWFSGSTTEFKYINTVLPKPASGTLFWLHSLSAGLSQVLRQKRMKRALHMQAMRVALLCLENFGQNLFVGLDDDVGMHGLHALFRLSHVEVEVGAAEAQKEEGREAPEVTVQDTCVAARILEYCTAFLVDEDEEYPTQGTRWHALGHDHVCQMSDTLAQTHQILQNYFLDAEGEVRTKMDIALFPLLSSLMNEFDSSGDELDKLKAFFKARGVPV